MFAYYTHAFLLIHFTSPALLHNAVRKWATWCMLRLFTLCKLELRYMTLYNVFGAVFI